MQFWSEIILVISNQTRAAHSFDSEITHMIADPEIHMQKFHNPKLHVITYKNWTPLSSITIIYHMP